MKYLVCVLYILCGTFNLEGATLYSNNNGNWNSSSTWLRNGIASLPTCGDTIYVEVNNTVTVNSQESYTGCSLPLYIYVKGTLQFTNGNKLDLPCGSFVSVLNGGLIKKATAGGGNSTLISICNVTFWNAAAGPLSGPVYLPVSLLNFEATFNDPSVWMEWSTASEKNNAYFLLQQSEDTYSYKDIARVKGAGNSNITNYYSCVDNHPVSGVNYYRLCQVDFNGDGYCYKPLSVFIRKKSKLMVYPNPATYRFVSLVIESSVTSFVSFEVRNLNSAMVLEKANVPIEPGYNFISLNNYYHFRPSSYFITVQLNHEIYNQKLIVIE